VPVLTCPDVRAAVAWLDAPFGFAERVRIGEDHRTQLRLCDEALIVTGSECGAATGGRVTHSVLVRVDDAWAHRERAHAHGACIIMEPTDFEYGERPYHAEDLAGHRWTFSQTLADLAAEQWGGQSVGA
jgi:uncharacterized glyoxalase superfamily protein PhnB